MEFEENKDQPWEESNNPENQPAAWKYKVNWKEMTPEQIIESYNNLQSEFTKKSQKLSEYEKQGDSKEELEKKARELENTEKVKKEEENYNMFKSEFKTLSESQFKALRDLQKVNPDKSLEDIAKEYWMLDEAQINRAKSNRVLMWNNIWVKSGKKEEVTISDYAIKAHNLKSAEKIAEIRSNFGL